MGRAVRVIFSFHPIRRDEAEQVVDWRYPDECAMYDVGVEDRETSIREMLDPSGASPVTRVEGKAYDLVPSGG